MSTLNGSKGAKGALIEGQDPVGAETLTEYDERRVRQTYLQLGVLLGQRPRQRELFSIEALGDKGAVGQILNERELHLLTEAIENQIVRLRNDKLARDECFTLGLEDRRDRRMLRLVRVGLCVERTRVDEERHLASAHDLSIQGTAAPRPVRLPAAMPLAHAGKASGRVGRTDDTTDALADDLGLRPSAAGCRAPQLFRLTS